jgi:UDP-2-acetamido-2,6-beta-L-arabino-hexul-4-ose reductase
MQLINQHILVTGANGFIGKNLLIRLKEIPNTTITCFVRGDDLLSLKLMVKNADLVIHLAGENRPEREVDFEEGNVNLTVALCNAIHHEFKATGRHVPLVFTSSTQANLNNPYGRSKAAAENAIQYLAQNTGNPSIVIRLPGVFGKWCKPNYNSVVATFCYNIARELPIQINDPKVSLPLVYIDDVISSILSSIETLPKGFKQLKIRPEYSITIGELGKVIRNFANLRNTLMVERVGTDLVRALYATYISYLPTSEFSYKVPKYVDSRGVFVEMLKTLDSGQFSYFTANPGVTRGGHYHHTKTEKFLVIKGDALFRFRHIFSNEIFEIQTSESMPQIVDTIPGWAHEITNIGENEMVVILWANENFERTRPDTVACKV